MRIYRFFGSLILLCVSIAVSGQEIIILNDNAGQSSSSVVWTGSIVSAEDGESIIGAVMRDSINGVNAITNENGNFEISLSKQNYQFEISALGFLSRTIILNAVSSGNTQITLEVEDVLIDEVVIGGQAANERITAITPGLQRMDVQQLETQSKFFGEIDVLRSLQSVSGVNNTGEGASGFNVRGGNTDQNLILQDGHLLFNPSHALGFFSVFHPDLVQYLDLYKGGIPAKYGGRLSSVLSVKNRDGDKKKFKAKGGIGLISSRLSLEGPIIKDKVSFIVGGRYSYTDWIFGLVDDPAVNQSKAFFNDFTAKLSARISPTTNFGMSLLRSEDDFQLGGEARFDYSTLSGEAFLKQLIGSNLNLTLSANKGRYESSLFDIKGNDQSRFSNSIDYTRTQAELLYVVSDNFKINTGTEFSLYEISPGEIEPLDVSTVIPDKLDQEQGTELSAYLEGQLSLGQNLELSVGGRFTQFNNLGPLTVNQYEEGVIKTESNIINKISVGDGETIASYSGFEPRVSMRYSLDELTSIKLGYAKTYQYLAQISNKASATPIDVWQLVNNHISPLASDNFSGGIFKNFNDNKIEASLEVFYRKLSGVIDYRDFAQLLLNRHLETELVVGDGQTYGLELNFRKKYGTVRMDANYTFSSTQLQIQPSATQVGINRGEWYPANYDIPHVMNLNLTKQFEKSSFSMNFTYRSGRPTTAPVSSYTNDNALNIPIYSDRNVFRVPAFHRLDIAYTIGPFGKNQDKLDHSITLSVYNLYSRRNAYSVYFRQSPFDNVKAIRVATLGSVFPSITYNFNIK